MNREVARRKVKKGNHRCFVTGSSTLRPRGLPAGSLAVVSFRPRFCKRFFSWKKKAGLTQPYPGILRTYNRKFFEQHCNVTPVSTGVFSGRYFAPHPSQLLSYITIQQSSIALGNRSFVVLHYPYHKSFRQ